MIENVKIEDDVEFVTDIAAIFLYRRNYCVFRCLIERGAMARLCLTPYCWGSVYHKPCFFFFVILIFISPSSPTTTLPANPFFNFGNPSAPCPALM
jgi:hypothetical protein